MNITLIWTAPLPAPPPPPPVLEGATIHFNKRELELLHVLIGKTQPNSLVGMASNGVIVPITAAESCKFIYDIFDVTKKVIK